MASSDLTNIIKYYLVINYQNWLNGFVKSSFILTQNVPRFSISNNILQENHYLLID